MRSEAFSRTSQLMFKFAYFLPQCPHKYWKLLKNSWRTQLKFLSRMNNWHSMVSNSFIFLWRRTNKNSQLFYKFIKILLSHNVWSLLTESRESLNLLISSENKSLSFQPSTEKWRWQTDPTLWKNLNQVQQEFWFPLIYWEEALIFNRWTWSSTMIYLATQPNTSTELVEQDDSVEKVLPLT